MSMFTSLIQKDIREKKVSLIIYCIAGALMVWLYVSIFPSLQASAKDVAKILESMPKGVLKAFGAEGTGLENVESLLVSKQFGLIWPVLAIFLTLSRAAGSIAGEVESGTIGTLLSQPISRSKIFLSKYLAAAFSLIIFVISSVLITIPIISAYKLPFSPKYELVFAAICVLYGLGILGVGMAVSAIASERNKVYSLVGGSIMIMFVLNLISGLQPHLEKLKYLSVFYYFNPHSILVNHQINSISLAIFLVAAIAGFAIGLITFNKRDLSI